jgi:hypothetical protein
VGPNAIPALVGKQRHWNGLVQIRWRSWVGLVPPGKAGSEGYPGHLNPFGLVHWAKVVWRQVLSELTFPQMGQRSWRGPGFNLGVIRVQSTTDAARRRTAAAATRRYSSQKGGGDRRGNGGGQLQQQGERSSQNQEWSEVGTESFWGTGSFW